jgi:hypothetical protein
MNGAVDIRRRNRRLALALAALFALMATGSVVYIDWVDAGSAKSAPVQER